MVTLHEQDYQGEFRDGLRHGKGNVDFASGNKYKGTFKDGYLHGRGQCVINGESGECSYKYSKLVFFDGY